VVSCTRNFSYIGSHAKWKELDEVDRPLTLLLVEDDKDACLHFDDYLDGLEDVELVGVTGNAKQALELACDYLPDAVILDLELHQGGGDGLSFLAALKRAELSYTPLVLITTSNVHPMIHAQARRLGAAFIMSKQQTDYSAASVVDFLRDAKMVIQDSRQNVLDIPQPPGEKRKRRLTRLSAEFDRIGISPKMLGRNYLIEYILALAEDPYSNPITVAQQFGKTEKSVRHAMQNAINTAWANTDIEELEKHYTARIQSEKGVPTMLEFACHYRDKILMKQ